MHEDLALDASVAELETLEKEFTAIVKERVAVEPELKISRDAGYAENPMDRENIEETVQAESVRSLGELLDGLGLPAVRVPVGEETCPTEVCFDILVDSLKQVKCLDSV
jgi:hypothetical protein